MYKYQNRYVVVEEFDGDYALEAVWDDTNEPLTEQELYDFNFECGSDIRESIEAAHDDEAYDNYVDLKMGDQ